MENIHYLCLADIDDEESGKFPWNKDKSNMTSKDYRDFAVEQMGLLEGIFTKPMMGEFLLYWQGKYFGGIYDNRVLVKKTKTNEGFGMPEAIPYEGAKAMYQVNIDNREEVAEVIKATCEGLK